MNKDSIPVMEEVCVSVKNHEPAHCSCCNHDHAEKKGIFGWPVWELPYFYSRLYPE